MENSIKYFNQNDFDKNLNVSFVDENMDVPSNKLIFKHYISSLIIYGIALIIFHFSPFYVKVFKNFLYADLMLNCLYLGYLILSPFFLFIIKPKTVYKSHSVDIVRYFYNHLTLKGLNKNFSAVDFLNWLKPNYYEKQSMMIFFIKFLFAPQLFVWACQHFEAMASFMNKFFKLNSFYFDKNLSDFVTENKVKYILAYRNLIYSILFQFLFFIDCLVFFIGYFTESIIFNNKIKTVDTSFLGVFICLICYPPFNYVSLSLSSWKRTETYFSFVADDISFINWLFYIVALLLIILYVSASVSLFTKASNLTNRGIVSRFPYNIVRHPAYISKISLWWLASFCVIKNFLISQMYLKTFLYIIVALLWTFIYFLRAITEERHLLQDPEYRDYTKIVKYRFIPYVF